MTLLTHNLDMRWHRAKILVVKNRIMILWAAMFALWVFGFVLGFIILARIQGIVDRIEETQKGNTCILLIQPLDRTVENVTECVDNNRKQSGDTFQFTTPDSNSDETEANSPQPRVLPSNSSTPQTIRHTETKEVPVETPRPPASPLPPVQPVRRIIERVSPVTGLVECMFEEDTTWLPIGSCV